MLPRWQVSSVDADGECSPTWQDVLLKAVGGGRGALHSDETARNCCSCLEGVFASPGSLLTTPWPLQPADPLHYLAFPLLLCSCRPARAAKISTMVKLTEPNTSPSLSALFPCKDAVFVGDDLECIILFVCLLMDM